MLAAEKGRPWRRPKSNGDDMGRGSQVDDRQALWHGPTSRTLPLYRRVSNKSEFSRIHSDILSSTTAAAATIDVLSRSVPAAEGAGSRVRDMVVSFHLNCAAHENWPDLVPRSWFRPQQVVQVSLKFFVVQVAQRRRTVRYRVSVRPTCRHLSGGDTRRVPASLPMTRRGRTPTTTASGFQRRRIPTCRRRNHSRPTRVR